MFAFVADHRAAVHPAVVASLLLGTCHQPPPTDNSCLLGTQQQTHCMLL